MGFNSGFKGLKQLTEKKMAVDQPLHLLFVDLEKAYDSVPFTKRMESIRTLQYS